MKYRSSIPAFIMLTLLVISGCKVKEFIMPSWDVEMNIPLINQKYYVSDLIDSVNFFPAPGENIVFQSSGVLVSDHPSDMTSSLSSSIQSAQLVAGLQFSGGIPLGNQQNGMQIAYGLISQGTIRYFFNNISPELTFAVIVFSDVKDDAGNPLTIQYNGIQDWFNLNLAGYHIGTPGSDLLLTQLNFSTNIQANLPDGSPVGDFQMQILSGIAFATVRGKFTDLRMNIRDNSSQINIDYPGNIDLAANVIGADMNLHIINPSTFPFILYGEFYAINENTGAYRVIDGEDDQGTPYFINAATSSGDGITDIQFADSVDYLLSIMPTHIEMRNSYFRVNNIAGEIGEINDDDIITGEYTATAPFRFILYNVPILPRDPMKIEISSENSDLIENNIQTVSLQMGMVNQLPVGAEATLYFGTGPDIEPQNPATWIFSKSHHLSASDGTGIEQIVEINLNEAEIQFFTNPSVYMQMEFRFDATNGPVTITATSEDFIQIRSMIKINAHVDDL